MKEREEKKIIHNSVSFNNDNRKRSLHTNFSTVNFKEIKKEKKKKSEDR